MHAGYLITGLFFLQVSCGKSQSNQSSQPNQPNPSNQSNQAKKLVWADEFSTNGLPDTTRWGYDLGNGCPNVCGWGNNELQFYTNNRLENARVQDGHLIIEARKEDRQGMKYTSSRMVTKNKGDWRYGRFEIRAKLPTGKGIWPAIWMLPTKWAYGGWPESGEIDIMEFVGYMPDSVFGTVHTGLYNHAIGTQKAKGVMLKDLATAFHVYTIEWTEEKISFLLMMGNIFNLTITVPDQVPGPLIRHSISFLILPLAETGAVDMGLTIPFFHKQWK